MLLLVIEILLYITANCISSLPSSSVMLATIVSAILILLFSAVYFRLETIMKVSVPLWNCRCQYESVFFFQNHVKMLTSAYMWKCFLLLQSDVSMLTPAHVKAFFFFFKTTCKCFSLYVVLRSLGLKLV